MKTSITKFYSLHHIPLKISFVYFLFGITWILFSDKLLYKLNLEPKLSYQFQISKGFLYILITALVLHFTINHYISKLRNAQNIFSKNYEQTIYSFISIIDSRDSYTAGHAMRVSIYASLLALEMNLDDDKIELIRKAGILHDIGKIETPDSILLKPGKLSEQEYEILKRHVSKGHEILSMVDLNREIAKIILHHHEKWDGSGYPNGLKGDEIPIESQILTVADTYDAMTSRRIYKNRRTKEEAIKEIEELSGIQFSPKVVAIAKKVLLEADLGTMKTHLPITNIEIERLSFYFKNQLTGFYNKNFLKYVFNNKDSFNFHFVQSIYFENRIYIENDTEKIKRLSEKFNSFIITIQQKYKKYMIIEMDKGQYVILWENRNYKIHEELKLLLSKEFDQDMNLVSLYSFDMDEFEFLMNE